MKKFKVVALAMLLCVGMLVGCGASYAADESTVFVLKDGKIVSTDVEEFDENTYDADGLEEYIDNAIDTYNAENSKDSVKLKKLTIKDGKATVIVEYASAADYQKFNDMELYTGSVAEALAAGYSFDDSFASVENGNITPCDVSEFLSDSGYKVVIIRGNTNVTVKGTIVYVSATNTGYVDSDTIAIREGTSLLDTESVSESTQDATEVLGTEMSTEVQETSGGAVSDDDLLSATETNEVTFDFDEEDSEASDATDAFSQVYTYIIYK